MPDIKRIQPPEIFESSPLGFSQVVTSPPGKMVFISGQTALDKTLKIPQGMGLYDQIRGAMENLGYALKAAGASPSDVTMLKVYVVNYKPDYMEELKKNLIDFFEGNFPAQTWLGVTALALPEILVEIEAIAVV